MLQGLWVGVVVFLCTACISQARADDEEDDTVLSKVDGITFAPVTTRGFLILDGKFVLPPYKIGTSDSGELFVNQQKFSFESRAEPSRYASRSGYSRGSWNRGPGGRGSYPSQADRIYGLLESDSLLLLSNEQSQFEVYHDSELFDIIGAMLDQSDASIDVIPKSISTHLPDLRKDVELMTRLASFKSAIDSVAQRNHNSNQSAMRMDHFAFPLSLVGMVMVVFATGQLLLNPPPKPNRKILAGSSDESSSNTYLFVTLIVAFSVLDLIWTILASHDNSMRELNPIGRHLIASPMLLICFKSLTTGVAVAILLHLRSHRRVHLAAWWLCLLLTMLTARWLMFNSLLI
ncbi:MAG TPA: DUF5658 family protein [Pirellula sp.]|nr:DUF5658 family protein [Pirellula sp.]